MRQSTNTATGNAKAPLFESTRETSIESAEMRREHDLLGDAF